MFRNGALAQCNPLSQSPTTQSFVFPAETRPTHHHFFSRRVTQQKIPVLQGQIRSGSSVCSSKSHRRGGVGLLEADEFDGDGFEEDEEEEGEVIVPLKNMKEWLQNKPRGFGEGKVYNTSIEDKLVEEMEQSRIAQLANINKLKNSPRLTNPKKEELQKQKGSEPLPTGIRVRLVNLPKKKNIHRDLQIAFKEVSGIVNIAPVVSGNKKTREPVCKGLAFVDFKSLDHANRFMKIFSTQAITFGKIQKQVRCEIAKPSSEVSILEGDADTDFGMNSSSLDSWEENAFEGRKGSDDSLSESGDSGEENGEIFSSLAESGLNSNDHKNEPSSRSQTLKKRSKVRDEGKRTVPERKREDTPNRNFPGSANRLKMKEKSLLMGVFSKYGGKDALAAKGSG